MEQRRFNDRFGGDNLPHLLDKALENEKRKSKEAKVEAETDSLTGLPNRRALDNELSKMLTSLEVGRRGSDPDYILYFVIDLNRFKFLNDTHGHAKGDEALQIVAKHLAQEALERDGKAFRSGGDEFVLVLHSKGTLKDSIDQISHRIQSKMSFNIPTKGGTFNITVSVGGAMSTRDQFKNQNNLHIEADEKMYANKSANGVER